MVGQETAELKSKIMKLKQLIRICGMLLAAGMAACDTDMEPVGQRIEKPAEQDPAAWAAYMEALAAYKAADHYTVYARFDNNIGEVISEKNSLRSMPDSLDIVALVNPLSDYDREDLQVVWEKSTKVLLTADCSDPATAVEAVDKALAAIDVDGLDGIVLRYAEVVTHESETAAAAIAAKLDGIGDRMLVFEGNASFAALVGKERFTWFVLDVSAAETVFSLRSEVDFTVDYLGIPARKILPATTPSATIADALLEEVPALAEVARCVMAYGPLGGIAVHDVATDYYDALTIYPRTKEAIHILNPAYTE